MTYPEVKWLPWKFSSVVSKKATQRWLANLIRDLFPNKEIIEDYQDPLLLFPGTEKRMELDIFVPELNIAFEYQGEHHFIDTPFFGQSEMYRGTFSLFISFFLSFSLTFFCLNNSLIEISLFFLL